MLRAEFSAQIMLSLLKRRKYNLKTRFAFEDYSKASDNVIKNKLWNIMEERGMPHQVVKVIKSYIRINRLKQNPEIFLKKVINKGVRPQCCRIFQPMCVDVYKRQEREREWGGEHERASL